MESQAVFQAKTEAKIVSIELGPRIATSCRNASLDPDGQECSSANPEERGARNCETDSALGEAADAIAVEAFRNAARWPSCDEGLGGGSSMSVS